jgi:hypothetical protein
LEGSVADVDGVECAGVVLVVVFFKLGGAKKVALEEDDAFGLAVERIRLVVLLGHIAMPSMMHGSSGEGYLSVRSVGSAVLLRNVWCMVRVTVTTAVLVSLVVVAASSCGSAEVSLSAHSSRLSIV